MEAKTTDKLPGLTIKELRALLDQLEFIRYQTAELKVDFKGSSDRVKKKLDWEYWLGDTLDKQRMMLRDVKAAIYDMQESGAVATMRELRALPGNESETKEGN